MSLYDSFTHLPSIRWKYYTGMPDFEKDRVLNPLCKSSAKEFIHAYFEFGKKSSAFDIAFMQKNFKGEKYEHTVSLYFLGCLFSELINEELKNYIFKYIPSKENWYDFRYTWFFNLFIS